MIVSMATGSVYWTFDVSDTLIGGATHAAGLLQPEVVLAQQTFQSDETFMW